MIFVPSILTPSQERRGIVLLVVMALLTLFAAVGLSFVFYAEAASTAASYSTDAGRKMLPDVDPELLLSYYLGQAIYDADNTNGVYSAMRGHSLARTMYGYNPAGTNMNPYSGVGRLHTGGATGVPAQNTLGGDDYFGVNYTKYASDGFTRHPELYSGTYVGCNVSYTYPDLNNMFLAAVNANGEVLAPSFYRSWTGIGSLDPSNGNWKTGAAYTGNAWTKYLTLRPLPNYNPNFPPPEDGGGDVKNFPFGPGTKNPAGGYFNNDSIWMDLGFPVQIAPNGQKFKPLFAALIVDLDGKVNLNVHGNNRGGGAGGRKTVSVSNQGYGPGEINISQVLTSADWVNILKGNGIVVGRHGLDGQPGTYQTTILPAGPQTIVPAPAYSLGNLASVQEPLSGFTYNNAFKFNLSNRYQVPGEGGGIPNPAYSSFPYFDKLNPVTYPRSYPGGDIFERTNIWMALNFYKPVGDDRPFGWSEMEALLRYGDTGSPAMFSSLFSLSPNSFGNTVAGIRARRLVTTHSFDLGRPGATPWILNPWASTNAPYQTAGLWTAPAGTPVSSPNPLSSGGEFGADFRGVISALNLDLSTRMSLNRALPDYFPNNTDGDFPLDGTGRLDSGTAANITKRLARFNAAQSARQQFAQDIFNRLCWVTTGGFINPVGGVSYWYTPGSAAPGTDISTLPAAQYNAFQWLAQLAVNIVDYIDNDSIITPFNWDTSTPNDATASPNKWVYGTELPRLVINETYSEVDNDVSELVGALATKPFQVNLWAELLCPLPDRDGSGAAAQLEQLQFSAPTTGSGMTNPYAAYKLAIQTGAAANLADQTLGTPTAASTVLEIADFTNPATGLPYKISPVGTAYNGAPAGTAGFFVVGPRVGTRSGQIAQTFPGAGSALVTSSAQVGPSNITGATNAAPIKITTGTTAGMYTGAKVIIRDVGGNIAANGPWTITVVDGANFTLNTSDGTGSGVYVAGTGTWVYVNPDTGFTSAVSYPVPNTTTVANYPKHNMILRRLACPSLPPNPYKAAGGGLQYPNLPYNPYVTVDYVQNIPPNDGVTKDSAGAHTPTLYAGLDAGGNFQGRFTQGRNQPYAATQFMNSTGRAITGATNASPIVITSANHGFANGDKVFITGVKGNTNANSTGTNQPWTIGGVTANTFSLATDGTGTVSTGNAAYVSDGTVYYADRPQHTLFRHNGIEAASPVATTPGQTLKLPFDWLVHMDRYLISPMEILHTSGFPPYLLTQKFMPNFGHIAPWVNGSNAGASARLYRFFEYVDVNSRASGVSYGGRIPGKINVNSIWDVETLMALCDPNGTSTFTAADVNAIFTALVASRTPSGMPGPVGVAAVANDRPFRSFASGVVPASDPQFPQGLDIGDTFLRGVFDVPAASVTNNGRSANPYLVKELLNKIYSNLTTRSNTFALFLTVGFFAVDQDTDSSGNPIYPPVLGAEIGKSEGRNIRHRMFALIDRSELRVFDKSSSGTGLVGSGNIAPVGFTNFGNDPYYISSSMPLTAPVTVGNYAAGGPITGTGANGAAWTLQAGMALEVDSVNPLTGLPSGSGNDETVVVQSVSGNQFTATFYKNHNTLPGGVFTLVGRGNPGPWNNANFRYDARKDTKVVPYFSIIE